MRTAIRHAAALAAAAVVLAPAIGAGATAPMYVRLGRRRCRSPWRTGRRPSACGRRGGIWPVRLGGAGDRRQAQRVPLAHAPYDRGPQTLLVLGARGVRGDGVWYRVLLPSRPNTSSAWVPASSVRVQPTPWRVRVRIGARRARNCCAPAAWCPGGPWPSAPPPPTPVGRFAVSEIVRQADPAGFFGPAHPDPDRDSAALSDFDGGDGRVALHGTNLPDLLGTAASHGSPIRLPNAGARRLAAVVPPGAPVDIVR